MNQSFLIKLLWIVFFVEFPEGRGYADTFAFTSLKYNEADILPVSCTTVLQEFAESASNFTQCAILNARPIHMCEHCVPHYTNFKNKYSSAMDHLVNTTGNDTTTCRSMLISKDKLEVVLTFHNNIQALWNTANCDVCFDWTNGTPITSNHTLHFYKLFNATKECLNQHFNDSEEACKVCKDQYLTLDEYYQSLSGNGNELQNICMDIIDSMNVTRLVWSGTLNCCRLREHPEIIFLCCTGLISALPLMFYLVLRYFGQMRDLPKALKQTRFKQTFRAALQSRRQSSS